MWTWKPLGSLMLIVWCVSGCTDGTTHTADNATEGGVASNEEANTPDGTETTDTITDTSGMWLDEATYVLEWDQGSAELDEDGQGWTVLSDQGYRVHVERGYLVNYSASLAPCDYTAAAPRPRTLTDTLLAMMDTVMGVSVAHAGHGDEDDPSAVRASRVEDIARPGTVVMDALAFPGDFYCRFHYLVARGDAGTESMPEDTDMESLTLYLEGTWSQGDAAPVPFTLSTAVNHGTLPELSELLAPEQDVDGEATAVTVTVSRKLDTLFDGIKLAEADAEDVERGVLVNLLDHATIEAVVW